MGFSNKKYAFFLFNDILICAGYSRTDKFVLKRKMVIDQDFQAYDLDPSVNSGYMIHNSDSEEEMVPSMRQPTITTLDGLMWDSVEKAHLTDHPSDRPQPQKLGILVCLVHR